MRMQRLDDISQYIIKHPKISQSELYDYIAREYNVSRFTAKSYVRDIDKHGIGNIDTSIREVVAELQDELSSQYV